MTAADVRPATRQWWDSEPDRVRAVIDLAAMRQATVDDAHDRVLHAFTPGHETRIAGISNDLQWLERCGWDDPGVLLYAYYGAVRHGKLDEQVDVLAEMLRRSVLTTARFVAGAS